MANNYDINYNDERFAKVESDKNAALNEIDKTYGEMIGQSDKYYQDQINTSKEWADKQTQLQNQQTDFAIKKIEQQKEQAKKDYTKEQAGAYVDWQKQSDPYGANAEKMASAGLANSGFSESSQVSMYNTYQNRVASARESYGRAVLNYDNAIKDAWLQNSSVLAEIAYEALQKQLELSLQGFQYKNTLLLEKANKKTEANNTYYQRYQDVLQQINTENALAEQVRQYNESLAEEKRQYDKTYALQQAELQLAKDQFAWQKAKAASSSGGGGGSGGSGGGGGSKSSGGYKSKKAAVAAQANSTKASQGSNKNSSGSSGGSKVDMQSVLNLGFGPISASELNDLESRGIIESYVSGGKIKFRKTASTFKNQMLFR